MQWRANPEHQQAQSKKHWAETLYEMSPKMHGSLQLDNNLV
jgi:hypothetical protein